MQDILLLCIPMYYVGDQLKTRPVLKPPTALKRGQTALIPARRFLSHPDGKPERAVYIS